MNLFYKKMVTLLLVSTSALLLSGCLGCKKECHVKKDEVIILEEPNGLINENYSESILEENNEQDEIEK